MLEFIKRNDALISNPVTSTIGIHITEHGSDWLWAVFTLFTVFFLIHGFLYASPVFKQDVIKKNLILVPFVTNAVLSIAYFTYASNLGYASQVAEFTHVTTGDGNYTRQIFYTKFIGWFVAWPAALLAITIATSTLSEDFTTDAYQNLAGVVTVFSAFIVKIFATEVFVLGLLIGSLIHSTYKWGYFVFAVVAQLFVTFLIFRNLLKSLKATNRSTYAAPVVLLQVIVWLLYPVSWALSEGGNVLQPDSEAVFYGILDLFTFSFIPTALTWINISILDDEFFQKLIPLGHSWHEKLANSPRHSGDTAVASPPQEPQNPDQAIEV